MFKTFFLAIFFAVTSFQAQSATVRLNDNDNPVVQLVTGATFSLIVDEPSGDGTSETAPAKTYVPIRSTAGSEDNTNYSTYGASATSLPSGTSISDFSNAIIRFYFDTASVSGTEYLHAAIKDTGSTDYEVVTSVAVTADENDKAFDVEIEELCQRATADLDCTNLLNTSAPSEVQDATVYFYIGSTQDGVGNTIDPASRTGGVYHQVFLSNRVYNTNTINMSDLVKGDGRLTGLYQGFTFENILRVGGFSHTGSCPAADQLFGASTGSAFPIDDNTSTSGEAIFKPLTNDTTFFFSVYFEDKFKWASKLSNCIAETPQEIEALLKENQCFLLTAGFKGNHPLIDYFRKFRSETLNKSAIGRLFIKTYYKLGPKLAPFVLENPFLAKTVRGSAYAMRWVIETRIWLVTLVFAMALALGTLMLVLNRREGEKLPWQVTANGPTSVTVKGPKTQNAEKSFPN